MASGNPRTVRVRYLDPVNGKDLPAEALFQQNTVLVHFEDGTQALLPYADGQLIIGGPKGVTPILVLVSGYQQHVRLYVEERHIGDRLDPLMPADLRNRLAKASSGGWWQRFGTITVLTAVVVGAAGIWYGSTWAFNAAIALIPTSADVALGKLMKEFTDEATVAHDDVVTQSIDVISDHLVDQLPSNQPWAFSVQVITRKEENAFALPGGPILVTTALIAESESPDEVAGILGHEIQHVVGRHTFHRMAQELGLGMALSIVLGDNRTMGGIARLARDLAGLSYDRSQETEADREGMRLANQAGYRSDAMGEFFHRMEKKNGLSSGMAKVLTYLSTHPADKDRIEQLAEIKQTLPPPGPKPPALPYDWKMVKKHAADLTAKAEN